MTLLVRNADGRNRCVKEDFTENLDPAGTHLCVWRFLHHRYPSHSKLPNEIRTRWLCKMKDQDLPADIWLDVDENLLKTLTTPLTPTMIKEYEENI